MNIPKKISEKPNKVSSSRDKTMVFYNSQPIEEKERIIKRRNYTFHSVVEKKDYNSPLNENESKIKSKSSYRRKYNEKDEEEFNFSKVEYRPHKRYSRYDEYVVQCLTMQGFSVGVKRYVLEQIVNKLDNNGRLEDNDYYDVTIYHNQKNISYEKRKQMLRMRKMAIKKIIDYYRLQNKKNFKSEKKLDIMINKEKINRKGGTSYSKIRENDKEYYLEKSDKIIYLPKLAKESFMGSSNYGHNMLKIRSKYSSKESSDRNVNLDYKQKKENIEELKNISKDIKAFINNENIQKRDKIEIVESLGEVRKDEEDYFLKIKINKQKLTEQISKCERDLNKYKNKYKSNEKYKPYKDELEQKISRYKKYKLYDGASICLPLYKKDKFLKYEPYAYTLLDVKRKGYFKSYNKVIDNNLENDILEFSEPKKEASKKIKDYIDLEDKNLPNFKVNQNKNKTMTKIIPEKLEIGGVEENTDFYIIPIKNKEYTKVSPCFKLSKQKEAAFKKMMKENNFERIWNGSIIVLGCWGDKHFQEEIREIVERDMKFLRRVCGEFDRFLKEKEASKIGQNKNKTMTKIIPEELGLKLGEVKEEKDFYVVHIKDKKYKDISIKLEKSQEYNFKKRMAELDGHKSIFKRKILQIVAEGNVKNFKDVEKIISQSDIYQKQICEKFGSFLNLNLLKGTIRQYGIKKDETILKKRNNTPI